MRWLIMVLLALPLCTAELVRIGDEPIAAGTPIEWELRTADPTWLVRDVQATPRLTITAPDGATSERAAFLWQAAETVAGQDGDGELRLLGEPGLRVRHVARQPGEHRWTLQSPAGETLAQGEFTVIAADRPLGPLRINPRNRRILAFASGEPFIPIGPNLAWAKPDRLEKFTGYCQKLHAAGGTHARVWLASWFGQFESAEPDAYDLGRAWFVDQLLAAARANELHLTIVIDNHHDLVEGLRSPYGKDYVTRAATFLAAAPGAQYERKLRYLLARWGADDTVACWELCNEVDMGCLVREISIPWIVGASHLMRRLDQDRRLHSVSWAGQDWDKVFLAADLDLVQLRGYVMEWLDGDEAFRTSGRDAVALLATQAARANQLDRPFLFGEVGYQGTEDHNPGNDFDTQGLLLRQQAWAGFLLGSCGSAMDWWWDVHIDAHDLWGNYRGLASAVRLIDWNDEHLVPLLPNTTGHLRVLGWVSTRQALLWPHARADTWFAHLVERRARPVFHGEVPFTLPGMRPRQAYCVRLLDQLTGEVRSEQTVTSSPGGGLPLVAPADCRDVAIVVTSE